MVGNRLGYPTYVLQAGAFLAGAFFLLKSGRFYKRGFSWGMWDVGWGEGLVNTYVHECIMLAA